MRGAEVLADQVAAELDARGLPISHAAALEWVEDRAVVAARLLGVTPEHVLTDVWDDTAPGRIADAMIRSAQQRF